MTRSVHTIHTNAPGPATLAQMGATAQATADTFTMREWAARLATRAGPKDYTGQLRQLYNGIVDRWRYVMEDGEWVHGTPRSLLGTVLGLTYNGVKDPTRAHVERTPKRERGWGDCDDVATLAASGVIALGMVPYFRVSRAHTGQAHVSVAAHTPRGELVQLDPVGHPEHEFGWAQNGPGIEVTYHTLTGAPAGALGAIAMSQAAPRFEIANVPEQRGPQFYPASMQPDAWQQIPYGFGDVVANDSTYLGVLARVPRGGMVPYQGRVRRHFVVVGPRDRRGARVLAVPGFHARTMMAGVAWDGTPAVDQFGDEYTYSQAADLWLPRSAHAARVAAYGFGETRADRKVRRKARRRRTMQKIGRAFKAVGGAIRKVISKVLGSKFVQTIAAGILQVFGMPAPLTKKLLAVAAAFVGEGGFFKLFKGLRKDPKGVLKRLAKIVSAAGRSDLLQGVKGFGAPVNPYETAIYRMEQHGVPFYAAPVDGICGLDGVFGDAGDGASFSERPRPGYYYRAKPGDNLSDVAEEAYGKALPGARWISQSDTNRYGTRAPKNDYEKKHIGDRVASFNPKFSGQIPGGPGNKLPAYWIPPALGVEPSVSPNLPNMDDLPEQDEPDEQGPPDAIPVPPAVPDASDDEVPEEAVMPDMPHPPAIPIIPSRPPRDAIPVEPPGRDPNSWSPGVHDRGPALGPVPGYNVPLGPADSIPGGSEHQRPGNVEPWGPQPYGPNNPPPGPADSIPGGSEHQRPGNVKPWGPHPAPHFPPHYPSNPSQDMGPFVPLALMASLIML